MGNSKHRIRNTLLLVASAAGAMHCFNYFISKTATINDKPETEKGIKYPWRFGSIYYKKKGSGAPLLLVHDFSPYGSSAEWDRIIDALAKDHTVYAIDLLGCGRSDKPELTYTNFLFVQLLTDFIKEVIKEKTDIVTSGISSSLGIMACTYDPTLFGKIFMINPASFASLGQTPSKQSKLAKAVLDLPILGTFIYFMMTSRGNIDLMLTEQYLFNPFQVDSSLVDAYYEASHRGFGNGRFVMSSLSENYMNANVAMGLKALTNDIYIIGGKQEPNINDIITDYQAVSENLHASIVQRAKHIPHYEVPDQVLAELKKGFDQ